MVSLDFSLSSMFLQCGCYLQLTRRGRAAQGMLLFNIVRGVLTLFLDWKDLIGDLFDDEEVNSICKALKEVEMDTCDEIVSVAF